MKNKTLDLLDYWIEGLFPLFLVALILGGIVSIIAFGIEYPIAFGSIMLVVIAPIVLGIIMKGTDKNE